MKISEMRHVAHFTCDSSDHYFESFDSHRLSDPMFLSPVVKDVEQLDFCQVFLVLSPFSDEYQEFELLTV